MTRPVLRMHYLSSATYCFFKACSPCSLSYPHHVLLGPMSKPTVKCAPLSLHASLDPRFRLSAAQKSTCFLYESLTCSLEGVPNKLEEWALYYRQRQEHDFCATSPSWVSAAAVVSCWGRTFSKRVARPVRAYYVNGLMVVLDLGFPLYRTVVLPREALGLLCHFFPRSLMFVPCCSVARVLF